MALAAEAIAKDLFRGSLGVSSLDTEQWGCDEWGTESWWRKGESAIRPAPRARI